MNRLLFVRQLKDFFTRHRRLILVILSIAIFCLAYALIIVGPYDTYRQNVDVMKGLNKDIQIAQQKLDQAKAYSSKIVELDASEKKILSMAMPDKPEYSSLLIHLTTLAQKAGFTVFNMDVEDSGATINKNSDKRLGKVTIKMKLVGGDYESLKGLVELLQNSVMMNDIYTISFSNKNPLYELSLVVYYNNASLIKK